jgi:hypothetical protein
MRFMNSYDLERAVRFYDEDTTPRRLHLAYAVANLAEWANNNSDGWAYWPKPCRAAEKAIRLIDSTTNAENEAKRRTDCTEAEHKAATVAIRSFLTRHGVTPEIKAAILGR